MPSLEFKGLADTVPVADELEMRPVLITAGDHREAAVCHLNLVVKTAK